MLLALVVDLFKLLLWPLLAWRRARAAPPGGYVSVEIDGPVVELPGPRRRLRWLSREPSPLALERLRQLARELCGDARARGVLLHVGDPAAGWATLASLRDIVLALRAAGKDVVAYLPRGASTGALFVASAARRVVVGPETSVAPLGYAARSTHVRRALARIGIEPEVFAKGAYKSAGEALVRDEMSDEEREQLGALLASHHAELVAALAQGRRVDRDAAARWIDEAPHPAEEARALGIVDAVAYEDELPKALGEPQLTVVPLDRYLSARLGPRLRPLVKRGIVGVVELKGAIVSSAAGPFGSLGQVAREGSVIEALRLARARRDVKSVVLHVDSRGGSALASDRIHHEVRRLAEEKPVIAYLGNVAASGGYYAACGAHAIIAQPQTVTGSIGVVAARFALGPLLERLGIATDVVKRGAHADFFSPSRRLSDDERGLVDREIERFYRTFLRVVAEGRRLSVEEVEPLAGGRIWSGKEARDHGLVDLLGGFERALHEARTLAGAPGLEPRVVRPGRRKTPPVHRPASPVPQVTPQLIEALLSLVAPLFGGGRGGAARRARAAEALALAADAMAGPEGAPAILAFGPREDLDP